MAAAAAQCSIPIFTTVCSPSHMLTLSSANESPYSTSLASPTRARISSLRSLPSSLPSTTKSSVSALSAWAFSLQNRLYGDHGITNIWQLLFGGPALVRLSTNSGSTGCPGRAKPQPARSSRCALRTSEGLRPAGRHPWRPSWDRDYSWAGATNH